MDQYLAVIYMFTGNYAPEGFATCEGQLLPIAQNQALYSIIGTTYGGNGTSNFQLPDLRGRVAIGYGQNPGNGEIYHMGRQADNLVNITLGTNNLPPHTHSASARALYNGSPSVQATGTVSAQYNWTIPAAATGADTLAPSATTVLAQGATTVGTSTKDTKMYVDNPSATVQMTGGSGSFTGTTEVTVVAPQITVTNGTTGGSRPFSIMPSYCTINYMIATQGIYLPRS